MDHYSTNQRRSNPQQIVIFRWLPKRRRSQQKNGQLTPDASASEHNEEGPTGFPSLKQRVSRGFPRVPRGSKRVPAPSVELHVFRQSCHRQATGTTTASVDALVSDLMHRPCPHNPTVSAAVSRQAFTHLASSVCHSSKLVKQHAGNNATDADDKQNESEGGGQRAQAQSLEVTPAGRPIAQRFSL